MVLDKQSKEFMRSAHLGLYEVSPSSLLKSDTPTAWWWSYYAAIWRASCQRRLLFNSNLSSACVHLYPQSFICPLPYSTLLLNCSLLEKSQMEAFFKKPLITRTGVSWHCHECINRGILGSGGKHRVRPRLLWIWTLAPPYYLGFITMWSSIPSYMK